MPDSIISCNANHKSAHSTVSLLLTSLQPLSQGALGWLRLRPVSVYSPLQTGASVSVTAGSNQAFPSPRLNPPPPSLFKAFHIDRKANTIMLGNQCYSWGESMKCKGKSHNVSLSAALHRLCQTCSIMQHYAASGPGLGNYLQIILYGLRTLHPGPLNWDAQT